MTQVATGTPDPPDPAKAKKFFDYARTVADSGQFDYAIELYVQGLAVDPEAVDDGHKALRDVALRRKAAGGGKPMHLVRQLMLRQEMARRGRSGELWEMLIAEQLLAYEPGNRELAWRVLVGALKAGLPKATAWAESVLGESHN